MGRMSRPRFLTGVLAFLLFVALESTAFAGIVIIGNPGLSMNSITAAGAADIFLGKQTTWPDGTKIVVVDQQDSGLKEAFYNKVVGKTPSQLKAYWAKLVFTGEGIPPKEDPDAKATMEDISSTAGAIGYVNESSVDKSVKVLYVVK